MFVSNIPPVKPSETPGKLCGKHCLGVSFQFFTNCSTFTGFVSFAIVSVI